jgi:acyl-CoA synthetase (AMP-forming)/AMP-acid ligase II
VETVLERHPAVFRCRVFGLAHRVLGTVPAAEVVFHPGQAAEGRELIDWCRKSLSPYKVPVRFKPVDALELTASGKIRRV